jgi:hypothetical protein
MPSWGIPGLPVHDRIFTLQGCVAALGIAIEYPHRRAVFAARTPEGARSGCQGKKRTYVRLYDDLYYAWWRLVLSRPNRLSFEGPRLEAST